jgi:hypothetical protein
MKVRLVGTLLILAGFSGCGSQSGTVASTPPTPPADVTHTYNGTASVGDFLTITLNTTALTIAYNNLSNGDSGTIPYTVNGNGSFTLNDPAGNLLTAYEIPGYALLIQAAKAGPTHNTPAVITAVETGPISMSTFSGSSYNYMQFRTAAGGLEVGSVTVGATSGQNSSYWPYGSYNQDSSGPFNNGTLDFGGLTEAASGTYISGPDGGGGNGNDYIFGTASGFFIVDTPNGSIIGLPKAATSAFDPTVAGTYNGIFYTKANASTGVGNVETGTASTSQASIVVTAGGNITVTDSNGATIINAGLTPVANSSYLYGTGSDGKLTDPCNGLFAYRIVVPNSHENDVFVTFVGNSVVFSKFSANLSSGQFTGTYSYWYGVGLK